ncbi:hypothetical protein EI94DRAFT_1705965 [Lactarius quietus]|nr:hypothetical protein EI94DRAFT_1705965 [Lactarius quietus]
MKGWERIATDRSIGTTQIYRPARYQVITKRQGYFHTLLDHIECRNSEKSAEVKSSKDRNPTRVLTPMHATKDLHPDAKLVVQAGQDKCESPMHRLCLGSG